MENAQIPPPLLMLICPVPNHSVIPSFGGTLKIAAIHNSLSLFCHSYIVLFLKNYNKLKLRITVTVKVGGYGYWL